MLWVLDYLPEIDADFRVFYRYPTVPDAPGIAEEHFGAFTGPQFLRLAWRLASYQGAVAAKVVHDQEKEKRDKTPRTPLIKNNTYEEITLGQTLKDNSDLIEYETA